jgi:hypothetical protein
MGESMSVTFIGDVVFECVGNSMTIPFTRKGSTTIGKLLFGDL